MPKATKQRRVSEALLREIVKANPGITAEAINANLAKNKVAHNETLVKGMLQMCEGKWLTNEKGAYSIQSASVITTLFKFSDPSNPATATLAEQPYSREAEAADPLLKRSKTQAVRAAKTEWYNTTYKATLKAWEAQLVAAKA